MKFELVTKKLRRRRAWLQFDTVKVGREQFQVDYELILPLRKFDCRGICDCKARKRPKAVRLAWLDADNCYHVPLGRTTVTSSNSTYPFITYPNPTPSTEINTPFRDGAHMGWDRKKLGMLRMYYRYEGKLYQLLPGNDKPIEANAKVP